MEDASKTARIIASYLMTSRFRVLGGSGNAWEAQCGVLDPVDFAARPWMPHSGWPFARRDLDPYYNRACELLKIPKFDYDPASPFEPDRPPLRIGNGERLTTATRHISPLRRRRDDNPIWALRNRRPLPKTVLRGEYGNYIQSMTEELQIDVYIHANVVDIQTDKTGAAIESLQVATLRGNRFKVHAKLFVLATGGIENVRLLLASNSVHKKGLGNAHDLVGRYFSGHFSYGANSSLSLSQRLPSMYASLGPQQVRRHLALRRSAQSDFRLPNLGILPAVPGSL